MFKQIADPNVFLAMARRMGAEVRVVRNTTAVPSTEGGVTLMRAAIEVHYSFQFMADGIDRTWVFRESRVADDHGRVCMDGTQLDKLGDVPHVIVDRAGSF